MLPPGEFVVPILSELGSIKPGTLRNLDDSKTTNIHMSAPLESGLSYVTKDRLGLLVCGTTREG